MRELQALRKEAAQIINDRVALMFKGLEQMLLQPEYWKIEQELPVLLEYQLQAIKDRLTRYFIQLEMYSERYYLRIRRFYIDVQKDSILTSDLSQKAKELVAQIYLQCCIYVNDAISGFNLEPLIRN